MVLCRIQKIANHLPGGCTVLHATVLFLDVGVYLLLKEQFVILHQIILGRNAMIWATIHAAMQLLEGEGGEFAIDSVAMTIWSHAILSITQMVFVMMKKWIVVHVLISLLSLGVNCVVNATSVVLSQPMDLT
jgi:hypothetical protein